MNKRLAFAAIALVAGLTASTQLLAQKGPAQNSFTLPAQNSPIDESLSLLRKPGNRDTKLTAARFIGSNTASVTPDLVHKLSQPLMKDNDVVVRREVADVMRRLVASHGESTSRAAIYEPQMLEILLTAFDREKDSAVRINIVNAAGQMNHPDALLVLDKAFKDDNPAVREAAIGARAQRDRRLLSARSG